MAFTRVQGTGIKYQEGSTTVGPHSLDTSALANFTAGNWIAIEVVHYADPAGDTISTFTINGVALTSGTHRLVQRVQSPNTVGQVEIWWYEIPAGTPAKTASVTYSGTGSVGGGHYTTYSITEWSATGTVSVVGATNGNGNSTAPSATTDAGTAIGDLILAAWVLSDSTTVTITQPSGYSVEWTEPNPSGHQAGSAVYRIAASAGAQAVTWGITATQQWAAVTAVINSTGGSGVTSTVAAPVDADFTAAVASSEAIPGTVAAAITGDFVAAVASSGAVTSTVAAAITADFAAAVSSLHAISGAFNGIVYGDSLAGTSGITGPEALSSRLQVYRPGDTWNRASVGALMTESPSGGAIGPGSFDFETLVHDVYYDSGQRNLVVLWSILHGDANDTTDTANQIFDRYKSLVDIAHGFGWEVCVMAIPATTEYNDPGGSPYRRPQRISINDLLRNGDGGSRMPRAGAEFFGDVETISGLGQGDVPISGNPGGTLIQADGIHLTAAGQDEVAQLVDGVLDNGNVSTVGASIAADFAAAVTSAQTFPSSVAAAITSDFVAAASSSVANPVTTTVAAEITADFSAVASSLETIPSAIAADDIAASFTVAVVSSVAEPVTSAVAGVITNDFAAAVSSAENIPSTVAAAIADDLTLAVSSSAADAVSSTVAASVTSDFSASASSTHTTSGDSVVAASITADFSASAASLQTVPGAVAAEITADFSATVATLLEIQTACAAVIANDFSASVASLESLPAGVIIDITELLSAAAVSDASTETSSSVAAIITVDFSAGISSLVTMPVDGALAIDMAGDFVALVLSQAGDLFVPASSPGRIIAGGTYNPRRRTV